MAKYIVTYENEKIKYQLDFRRKTYDYTMEECNFGRKADKPTFSSQLQDDGFDFDFDIDVLDCTDEDEILEILNLLDEFEW